MKKAISLFLALVMLVSVFAGLGITAYASPFCIGQRKPVLSTASETENLHRTPRSVWNS